MTVKNPGVAPITIGLNRYVHFAFFLAGFIVTYILKKVLEGIWDRLLPSNDFAVLAIAIVLASGATYYAWKHPRVNMLAKEIATELSKVTWPTRNETSAFTVTVIVTSVIAATILGLYDMFWTALTGLVY